MEMQGIPEEKEWRYVSTLLPEDLEESSFRMGALIRRREIPNATALIRMLMAYGVCDLSLKDVAAWAKALGVAKISGPGLFYGFVSRPTGLSMCWVRFWKASLIRILPVLS
jgi:hypothetical protein